jgi:hypothetical protein
MIPPSPMGGSELSLPILASSPASVLPLNAIFSSAMGRNRTMPLHGGTPSPSSRCFCIKAAFRLFVVGWSSEARVWIVRT